MFESHQGGFTSLITSMIYKYHNVKMARKREILKLICQISLMNEELRTSLVTFVYITT